MKIIVTGCVAQAEGEEIKKRSKCVDLIFGPQNCQNITEALREKKERFNYTDFLCEEKFERLPISTNKEISKLVTIQEGCDKFPFFVLFRTLEELNTPDLLREYFKRLKV